MRELTMSQVECISGGGGASAPIHQTTFSGYWSSCMASTSLPASANTAIAIAGIFNPIAAAAGAFIAIAPAGICALGGLQTLQ
jgi:hypothetical protein